MSGHNDGIASLFRLALSRKDASRIIAASLLTICSIMLLSACQPTSTGLEQEVVGLWRSNDGVYVRIGADGTLTAAWSLEGLDSGSLEKATYRLEGNEFVWIPDEDSPSCKDVGRYEVTVGDEGELQFSVIEDSCAPRRADLGRGPMRPVSE